MKKSRLLGAMFIAFSLNSPIANAYYIYEYTADSYSFATSPYDTSMNLSGLFELETVLEPDLVDVEIFPSNFSFFDGVNTLNSSNTDPDFTYFIITTDNFGAITEWAIGLREEIIVTVGAAYNDMIVQNDIGGGVFNEGRIVTCTGLLPPPNEHFCGSGEISMLATLDDVPGVWTVSSIPLPPAIWLFGSGLLGLIGVARKKS